MSNLFTQVQATTIRTPDLDADSSTLLTIGSANANKVEIANTGIITEIQGNLDVIEGLDVTGNITVSGTVDGIDVAAHDIATTGVHGVGGGNIVGTTLSQTLTNKTLTSPRVGTSILDINGNELFTLNATASAVNEISITNSITGVNAILGVSGESNRGLTLQDSNSNEILILNSVASAVNELSLINAATGSGPTLSTTGETNVDLNMQTAGTGKVKISAGSASASGELRIEDNTGGQYVGFTASAATTSYTLTMPSAIGATGNILSLSNGTGSLQFLDASSAGANFSLLSNQVTVNNASVATVAYFAWDNTRYGSFPAGRCIMWIENMTNRGVDADVYDGTSVIGSISIPSSTADGIQTFTMTNPVVDKRLEVRVTKSSSGGASPNIYGIQFKF